MLVGSMSEPTLYPHFLELIDYLKSRDIKIEICTNGDTRDDQFWLKLGQKLDQNDSVYFTICGSTQEMHEHYRKGTNLLSILHNAEVFRMSGKHNDYAQCIRFNYNSDDFDSNEFKRLVENFSHVYMTETFYPKNISNYSNKFNIDDFIPNKHKIEKYNKIKNLAEKSFQVLKNVKADCQSIEFKRQQIDVFGNVYPCYLFLEHENGKSWNYSYEDITNMKYDCCKFCSSIVKKCCKQNNLEYII